MTDIVKRLRMQRSPMWDGERIEAADEIERLRAEKADLLKKRNAEEMQRMIDYWGKRAEKAEAEIEGLRAENEDLQGIIQFMDAAKAQSMIP